jgi:transposase-like protein
MCPSCVQRRRRAWFLVSEQGESVESVARTMGLAPELVRKLVDEEADRRELESFRCDSIPVALTREVISDALKRDPELRIADIAGWLDMPQSDFERAFLGKSKDGRPKRRVNVSSASRLMIALGRAPNELPGC